MKNYSGEQIKVNKCSSLVLSCAAYSQALGAMTGPVVSLTLFAAIGNNTTGTVLQWYTVLATASTTC